jgi:enoyl-CoA hydratase/carnithine racemase
MDAPVFQFMQALGFAEKPVVAAVNGAAVGIGTTMLMHCDLVYCADNAMFSMPFVSLGLCSEFASSLTIPLAAGFTRPPRNCCWRPISAEDALEMKIVNRILPPGEVLDHAIRQAERFNALPPASVRETKRLMKSSWRAMTEKLIVEEAKSFGTLLRSEEAKEAFSAFFDRRKPDFSRFSDRGMALRHEMTLEKLTSRSGDNLPGWFSMKVVELREGSLTMEYRIRPQYLAPNGFRTPPR